ncbi:hypothetical protein [Flavobacterium succinicans]|uniref:Uncharacterized protein n=1 Tax=Flavobacterium succinicans TaxID=29536 RepID=A0A199XND3_9FLAO|nr:hypothetical protein [Flavobacterium succinicans]OAZ02864.1 hypothetical protein FLB_28420 [Flavobacterium succinicans]
MELYKIEELLEKYFQGESSIAEEKELTNYFSSSNVAQHLEQYQPLFGYFSLAKEQINPKEAPEWHTQKEATAKPVWWSLAASVVILLGIGMYVYTTNETKTSVASSELGTCDTPEEAFRETQKALALLSGHVNTGIESVQVIQEYDKSKGKVFNQ